MEFVMKTAVSLVLVLLASPVLAEDCNVQMDAGLRMSEAGLAFYDKEELIYQIKDQRHLVIDGQTLALSPAQQALVPEIKAITLEGIDMAIEGVTRVLDDLLGKRNDISMQLHNELNHLKGDVRRYFDQGIINVNRDQEPSELFGKHFETRMTRIMETSVQDSIEEIMIAIGKEILRSGGDVQTFEARMERFGKEIEAHMRAKAVRMEARGRDLCRAAIEVNQVEDELRLAIPAIRNFDLIQVRPVSQHTTQKI
jgi:hypothetical protein